MSERAEFVRYRQDLLGRSHWEAASRHYEWEPPDDWFEEKEEEPQEEED